MSTVLPSRPPGSDSEREHPRLHQRPLSRAEQRALWEVRAAQWRARELAEAVFGAVGRTGVIGMRSDGPLRGLMRLDVPFDDLEVHRVREERFMAAVESDPLLANVHLVYVIGPESV